MALTDAQVKNIAKQSGKTEAEVRAAAANAVQQSDRQFYVYGLPGNADQGEVYLGQQNDPNWEPFPGLPNKRPATDRTKQLNIWGHPVNVIIPEYGAGYTIEYHTTLGHKPTPNEIEQVRQRKDKSFGINIFVYDADHNKVDSIALDEDQINQIVGTPAPKKAKKKDEGGYWQTITKKDVNGNPVPKTVWISTKSGTNKGPGSGHWEDFPDEQGINLTPTGRGRTFWVTDDPKKVAEEQDTKSREKTAITVVMDPYAREKLITDANGKPREIPQTDQVGNIESEIKSLYSLPPATLRKYKTELFLAGYYGDATLDQINMNTITGDDLKAFGSVMASAAGYWAADKKVTWQQLLSMEAADPSAKHRGPKTPVIPLSDPEAITLAANETGTKVLGRAPTAKDIQGLVAMIHSREMAYGKAQAAGGGGGIVQPDVNADMEQWMRKTYPNEAMAVDWGSNAQVWEQLLASTSPQPRIVGAPGA